MNNDIFFSIITPNYNSGNKLLRAINSLQRNNVSFEHIVIDDNSDDNSFLSAKNRFEDNYSGNFVFLKNETNSGPGYSRNRGLDIAKGKYIIFMDADDYLSDHALDYIYSIINAKDSIDVLLFKHQTLVDDSYIDITLNQECGELSQISDPLREYLLDKIISSPWGKCIKASLAKKFSFPDLRVSQDAPYNLDIFSHTNNVYKTDSILYFFDKTNDNSITRKSFNRVELSKFYKSWNFFENKALKELTLSDSKQLISARKIMFCASYYINRLVLSKKSADEDEVIDFIREIISKNIMSAWSKINIKFKGLCLVFYIFPDTTIFLLRKLKPYGL